ncbi:hypothetical protein UY3_02517 [Chelonia mydas]|uniref:Uncharacterized protein n=1 Tax=Chelonia mydas TaxID=8469 RepID=M7BWM7_CHEMY|nr:hypothetical protein UY3_02517 [Chelonia mydas]
MDDGRPMGRASEPQPRRGKSRAGSCEESWTLHLLQSAPSPAPTLPKIPPPLPIAIRHIPPLLSAPPPFEATAAHALCIPPRLHPYETPTACRDALGNLIRTGDRADLISRGDPGVPELQKSSSMDQMGGTLPSVHRTAQRFLGQKSKTEPPPLKNLGRPEMEKVLEKTQGARLFSQLEFILELTLEQSKILVMKFEKSSFSYTAEPQRYEHQSYGLTVWNWK